MHMYCFRVRRRSSSSRLSKSRHVLEMKTPCAGLEVDMKLRTFPDVCTTKQLLLNEQTEQARALNSIRLLQESILCPEDSEEDYATTRQYQRPASPDEYSLAIDYTAAKMVNAVIDKCKFFQCVSLLYREESHELLSTLVGLHERLQTIVGCPCLNKFQEALEDIMLYSTKAYAYLEKLCFTAAPSPSNGMHKAAAKINEFACRFYNLTVRFCEDSEQSWDHGLSCASTPRGERLSFGVTTYAVPIHDVAERLLKKKWVHIPLTDLEGTSEYNVELSCPRSLQWFSKSVAMSAKVDSHDRGFSQTLHADRVKMEKGSWGWEEAQDTVLLTYDDLVVANVASVTGSLLTYNKQFTSSSKQYIAQKYRTSIQIVGSSRIDLDLQNLFIKGVKDGDHIFYKCFVNSTGREEVLGIYRFQQNEFHKADQGLLHIVGRGNQPGLRHVLVSIFSSLGFTPAV